MILIGNQRSGARDLARHLLKDENERVTVHDMRGFASDDLLSAFQESNAISRGTKCKQHLYPTFPKQQRVLASMVCVLVIHYSMLIDDRGLENGTPHGCGF